VTERWIDGEDRLNQVRVRVRVRVGVRVGVRVRVGLRVRVFGLGSSAGSVARTGSTR